MADKRSSLRPKIVFPHIMKTAGTSLNVWIQRHYPVTEVLSEASGWRELQSLPHDVLSQKRFVRGHFGSRILSIFGPHNGFDPIAILRDPAERVISHFWHLKYAADAHIEFNFVKAETFSIEDFLEHPEVRFITSNYQTGNLSAALDSSQNHYYTPMYRSEVSPVSLEAAKEFIERCAVVGITEQMSRFIAHLSDRFGFFADQLTSRTRSYRQVARFSDEVYQRLRAVNELDYELYEFVKARLNDSSRKYYSVKSCNPNAIGDAQRLSWTAGEPFWGSGWSDVMYGPAPHVWSTVETSTFEIAVRKSGSYVLLVSIYRFVVPCQREGFSLLCDDEPVSTFEVEFGRSDERLVFAAVLGKASADRLRIGFRVNMLTAFSEIANDPDTLKKGCALAGIRVIDVGTGLNARQRSIPHEIGSS